MRLLRLAAGLFFLVFSGCSAATHRLVRLKSGDERDALIEEVERSERTSRLRVTYGSRGSAVLDSMFVMRGFCEVAKARGATHFVNLKEWRDGDGATLYIAGFTDDPTVGVHEQFGPEYSLVSDYGQARGFMSVEAVDDLFRRMDGCVIIDLD